MSSCLSEKAESDQAEHIPWVGTIDVSIDGVTRVHGVEGLSVVVAKTPIVDVLC